MLKVSSCLQTGLLLAAGLLTTGVAGAQERSRTMDTNPQTKQLLDRIEKEADVFEDKFDNALDSSHVNGTTFERRLNQLADTMEDAVDNMSEEYNEKDPKKFMDKLENALIAGAGIDRFMLVHKMTSATEEWGKLRQDLNEVAKAYHRPVLPNLTAVTLIPVTSESMSKPELKLAMERIEAASDRFEEKFDDSIQHSTANMTDREEMFDMWGEELEDATDEMMEQFKEKDYKEFGRRFEATMVVAEVINRIMLRSDLFKDAELQWKELREDLNKAAVVFGHPVLPNVVASVTTVAR